MAERPEFRPAGLRAAAMRISHGLRSSAPAPARSLFFSGPLFVPSIIMTLLPASWQDTAGHYLPMHAGETIYTVQHHAHTLQPWAGFGVFSLHAAAALVTDFILINHHDA